MNIINLLTKFDNISYNLKNPKLLLEEIKSKVEFQPQGSICTLVISEIQDLFFMMLNDYVGLLDQSLFDKSLGQDPYLQKLLHSERELEEMIPSDPFDCNLSTNKTLQEEPEFFAKLNEQIENLSAEDLIYTIIRNEFRSKEAPWILYDRYMQLRDFQVQVRKIANGDLTVRGKITHDTLGATIDRIDFIVEHFQMLLLEMPPDHPLRRKYKVE